MAIRTDAILRYGVEMVIVGVDGLILLTAGAGGQTGWLNPFAYARAVREIIDGPIVLAGGISDGWRYAPLRFWDAISATWELSSLPRATRVGHVVLSRGCRGRPCR